MATYGKPEGIVVYKGPESIRRVLDEWACGHEVELYFIEPSHPNRNASIELFDAE